MATPIRDIISTETATKSGKHTLRVVSALGFPPAFLFLLLHGIFDEQVFPALVLVPMALSSVYSFVLLSGKNKDGSQQFAMTGTRTHFILEFSLGLGLIAFLIPGWISLASSWRGNVMLGTYGTVFPMANFAIHSYFVLRYVAEKYFFAKTYCPHCHYGPFAPTCQQKKTDEQEPLLDAEAPPAMSDNESRDVQTSMV
ncbi:hypothetical protein K491DRAFT_608527 [Lophiostoma macrostomum CBS 122681]|uniref:Uncharacterized protein n=1 Tax=Lophiostoma macrostomum CBS 122681 TaxID=1314788 RepID=A0A6A6SSN9_9PLEO|nr:hypothetical protein K491DRAFT_608527 [Lophiostoma macrostomum CBS 122681]